MNVSFGDSSWAKPPRSYGKDPLNEAFIDTSEDESDEYYNKRLNKIVNRLEKLKIGPADWRSRKNSYFSHTYKISDIFSKNSNEVDVDMPSNEGLNHSTTDFQTCHVNREKVKLSPCVKVVQLYSRRAKDSTNIESTLSDGQITNFPRAQSEFNCFKPRYREMNVKINFMQILSNKGNGLAEKDKLLKGPFKNIPKNSQDLRSDHVLRNINTIAEVDLKKTKVQPDAFSNTEPLDSRPEIWIQSASELASIPTIKIETSDNDTIKSLKEITSPLKIDEIPEDKQNEIFHTPMHPKIFTQKCRQLQKLNVELRTENGLPESAIDEPEVPSKLQLSSPDSTTTASVKPNHSENAQVELEDCLSEEQNKIQELLKEPGVLEVTDMTLNTLNLSRGVNNQDVDANEENGEVFYDSYCFFLDV